MGLLTSLSLHLQYSAAQKHIFFDSSRMGRFRIFPKGRRVGITRGAAHAFIEFALDGLPCLWGETINSNIRRYVDRYFLPVLQKARIPHEWRATDKTLVFPGGGYIDFRSADNPVNWEGFGYKRIILNEMGIILQGERGRYLYENAVLPMMMDYKDSQLIAAGVPKGKLGIDYELYQKALSGQEGFYTYKRPFNVLDNPWIDRPSAEAFIEGYPEAAKDQEIWGKYLDGGDEAFKVIPRAWLMQAVERWKTREKPEGKPDALGVDVARGGKDKTVLSPRWNTYFGEQQVTPGKLTPDGASVAALVVPQVGPSTAVNIDIVGVGTSPYDHIKGIHDNTFPINGSAGTESTDSTGLLKMRNLRAELYWSLREALDPSKGSHLAIPDDLELIEDLCAPMWKLTTGGILIQAKDDIIADLGRSPDKGDSLVYAHHVPEQRGGFFIAGY